MSDEEWKGLEVEYAIAQAAYERMMNRVCWLFIPILLLVTFFTTQYQ